MGFFFSKPPFEGPIDPQNPQFIYPSNLGFGQIRVLRQRPYMSGTLLSFDLEQVTISSRRDQEPYSSKPYIALSYCWGDERNGHHILVNDQKVYVTRNLFLALTDLERELQDFPIWIDALCIRQFLDFRNSEKKHQIDNMDNVYRCARQVLVHIGDSTTRTDRAMNHLISIGSESYQYGVMNFREKDIMHWPDFASRPNTEILIQARQRIEKMISRVEGRFTNLYHPSISVKDILDLFAKSWFERVWVVQEVAVAQNRGGGNESGVGNEDSVVFACGKTHRISWQHIWAAHFFLMAWIMKEGNSIRKARNIVVNLLRVGIFRARVGVWIFTLNIQPTKPLGARKKYIQGEMSLEVKSLLTTLYVGDSSRPLQCRDKVDKFRALVGMASDGGFLSKIMEQEKESWIWFYTAAAKHLIKQGHIDLLSVCRLRNPDCEATLPSWVADWSIQQRPPWLGFKDSINDTELFDAGKGTFFRCLPEISFETLHLLGFRVDRIKDMGMDWAAGPDASFETKASVARFAELRWALNNSRYSKQDRENAFWRILIGDKETNSMEQVVRATEESRKAVEVAKDAAINLRPAEVLLSTEQIAYTNMMMSMFASKVFLSETGYVGLCPSHTKIRDTIFIPCGGHCPYVITEYDGKRHSSTSIRRWILKGEAYVYGIMDGELDLGGRQQAAEEFLLF